MRIAGTSLYDKVSSQVEGPRLNPFAAFYWQQFGGSPAAEDYDASPLNYLTKLSPNQRFSRDALNLFLLFTTVGMKPLP